MGFRGHGGDMATGFGEMGGDMGTWVRDMATWTHLSYIGTLQHNVEPLVE